MKKIIGIGVAATLLATALVGCTATPEMGSSAATEVVSAAASGQEESFVCEYTNLVGERSREKVESLLKEAGISQQRRAVFWDHVTQFNTAVDRDSLQGEFGNSDILHPAYDPYALQAQWAKAHPEFEGYNCRITAFSLFGDDLTIGKNGEIRDEPLFLDKESLTQDPSALMSKGEQQSFLQLFSTVPATDTTDPAVHVQTVQTDWKKREISFQENDRVSLITVWFHDRWSETENELFIGHTGVLLNGEDGLYFVEKLAFQEPYVVTRFDSREQVQTYLMKKYNTAWDQNTAPPFVMENDHLMV